MKLSEPDIEANKDKSDLSVEVGFVSANFERYEGAWNDFMNKTSDPEARSWGDSLDFDLGDCLHRMPEPAEALEILGRMPKVLRDLSALKTTAYYDWVIIPKFDDTGNFNGGVEQVYFTDFPREGDHPSRVLVGSSNGNQINQTHIPESVSTDLEARKMYQRHVYMHEFFHTAEYLLRYDKDENNKFTPKTGEAAEKSRQSVQLISAEGELFTLHQWWEAFEALCTEENYTGPSIYASVYEDDLRTEVRDLDYTKFQTALVEQMCEAFVGHQLGVLPNEEGYDDFKQAKPELWALIDKLVKAELLNQ